LLDSTSDGAAELTLLNLRTFTCRHLDNKELEAAGWPNATDSIFRAAMHTGLAILAVGNEEDFSLLSFLINPKLRAVPPPAMPGGFGMITEISIDEQYICIAGHSQDSEYLWEINIWDRSTRQPLKTLTGPMGSENGKVFEWVEDIFMQKDFIVAVTALGRLFYWDKNFVPILDRSSGLTDGLMHENLFIDTVWLSQDGERVVMMNLLENRDAAMVLDNKPSFIPAVPNRTEGPEYLRMDADCQTVVCGSMPHPRDHVPTPQFEVYSISESQPCFRVEPLNASIEHELGSFVDVSVNDYALTLFGTEGAIQIRFVGQNTIPDETRTSSRYLPLDWQGWVTLNERDVQNSQETRPAITQIQNVDSPGTRRPTHGSPEEETEVYGNPDRVLKKWQANGEELLRPIVSSNDKPRDTVPDQGPIPSRHSKSTRNEGLNIDIKLRPRKKQRLTNSGDKYEVHPDPDNVMDNWLLSSRKLKMERTSKKEIKRNAWMARKALDPPYAGMWQFSTDNSNERTWVKPQSQGLDHQFDQQTNQVTLVDTINGDFFDEEENREVLNIYQQFWLRGDKQGFFNTLHQHLSFNSNSEADQNEAIPEESVWKVFRCLIGALVPEGSKALRRMDNGELQPVQKKRRTETGKKIRTVGEERAANEIDGFPKHVVAGPDTIWQVGKCMLQLLTRGRFWDDESNVLNPVDNNEKFGVYKQTVLQQKYSKNLIKHILACLTRLPENRPTQDDLLQHFRTIFSVYDGTYQPKPVDEESQEPYQPKDPRIPTGLTREEGAVYETLIKVVEDRSFKFSKDSIDRVPNIFGITDLAKDYDDLAALLCWKELRRLGVVRLKKFVANLMPARKRALFGRGALNHLGLKDIEIGVGSVGDVKRVHDELSHEFKNSDAFIADPDTVLPEGQDLLREAFSQAAESNEKLTLVLISSLMDISTFAKTDPEILKNGLSNVVLQGGYRVIDGILTADLSAQNNKFDTDGAAEFHAFMQENQIESAAWSKVVALKTPISETLFKMLGDSQDPLGEYIHEAQKHQDQNFSKPCFGPKKGRFAPHMTKEWFIAEKTNWLAAGHEPDEGYPEGDDLTPFFTKPVVYDALVAVGSAGEDVLEAFDLPRRAIRRTDAEHPVHRSFGILPIPRSDNELGKPEEANLNLEEMGIVVTALMKGSILALQQGI
jgi:hypothetical protein